MSRLSQVFATTEDG